MAIPCLALLALSGAALGGVLLPDMPDLRLGSNPLDPISGRHLNPEYLEYVSKVRSVTDPSYKEAHGQLKLQQRRVAQADRWNTSSLKGANYIPSTSHNSIETWLQYDPSLVARELSYCVAANLNAVRVTLHWLAWLADPDKFASSVEALLSAAKAANVRVLFVLFDSFGGGDPTPDWLEKKTYVNHSWVANPGPAMLYNSTSWHQLELYVQDIVSKYARDPRVLGWDLLNEPALDDQHIKGVLAFVSHFSSLVAAHNPGSDTFTTVSFLPGGSACPSGLEASIDVVSIQNYNGNLGAVWGDIKGAQGCPGGKSVMLSGFDQDRTQQSICEVIFECYGQIETPLLHGKHPPAGYFVSQLVIGVNQFSAMQGLVYPGGKWFSESERQCLKQAIPPVPPLPPGPNPPVKNFTTGGLNVGLRANSHTVQILGLSNDTTWGRNFSFVPPLWGWAYPKKANRSNAGAHQLGDLTLRIQPTSESNVSSWATYSSSHGAGDVACIPADTGLVEYDKCDMTASIASPGQIDTRYPLSLRVVRTFSPAENGNGFIMSFTLTANESVRVGGLGFSMTPDSTWGGLTTDEVAATVSFIDPHIGLDHGFATWSRADGSQALLVTPANNKTKLEAWRPILEDNPEIQAGTSEWTVLSHAWAQDWKVNRQTPFNTMQSNPAYDAAWPPSVRKSPWPKWYLNETVWSPNPQQWNPPTFLELGPGESIKYALRFTLLPEGPPQRDDMLVKLGRPAVKAVPGYVVAPNMNSAFLFFSPPHGAQSISSISVNPSTAMTLSTLETQQGWIKVKVSPHSHGRARVAVQFSDQSIMVVHMFVVDGLQTIVEKYGNHSANLAWLPLEYQDPFARGASVMPWDREESRHVLQDGRPFVVGLSDDAGGGGPLGFATKVRFAPDQFQATRVDDYIKYTLYGQKNYSWLAQPNFQLQEEANDRILMTVFYYHYTHDYSKALQWNFQGKPYYHELPKCIIGPSWCSFNALIVDPPPNWHPNDYRVFNFPHQLANYWTMYHIGRYHSEIRTYHPWSWYLERSFKTLLALGCYSNTSKTFTCIPPVGVMDGTVFREILNDMSREGIDDPMWLERSKLIRSMFYNRTVSGIDGNPAWNDLKAPFGSEFNWDTTGQEECAIWGQYFNASGPLGSLNERVVKAILAYMPSTPNWAYNGAAGGWGDFSNNAKWMVTGGWEREGQHYRAGLNAIPLIERFRAFPDEFYLLEVAMGGMTGVLTNIDQHGAASMAFHLHPFILEFDPNSGDHGLAFFGSSLNMGSYLVDHPVLGVICYLCDVVVGSTLIVTPRDLYHRSLYIEPAGLWVKSLAGDISEAALSLSEGKAELTMSTSTSAEFALVLDCAADNRPCKHPSVRGAVVRRGVFFLPANQSLAIVTWDI